MARVACSPITWGSVEFERVLDDIADTGYAGVELPPDVLEVYRRQPARLRGLLEDRTLMPSATPFTGWYFERDERKDELERLRRTADMLAEVAEGTLITFETVPHPARRDMVVGEPPLLPLTRDRFAYLAEALNQYCDLCQAFGLRGAFRNRAGSFVETPDELQEVIERTEPDLVWLAPDLGHWAYAGGDPAALIRTQKARLLSLRLKDLDQDVFAKISSERLGFQNFLMAAGFKELGEGSLDLETILMPLVNAEYDGWLCVELERTGRGAKESAAVSRAFLRERLHW